MKLNEFELLLASAIYFSDLFESPPFEYNDYPNPVYRCSQDPNQFASRIHCDPALLGYDPARTRLDQQQQQPQWCHQPALTLDRQCQMMYPVQPEFEPGCDLLQMMYMQAEYTTCRPAFRSKVASEKSRKFPRRKRAHGNQFKRKLIINLSLPVEHSDKHWYVIWHYNRNRLNQSMSIMDALGVNRIQDTFRYRNPIMKSIC